MTVADEAYKLYPEAEAHLQQARGRPDHEFFRQFGEQVPPPHWNKRGTKQGVYVMGPNAEYLGARFASPPGEEVARMLREALSNWENVKRAKGYRPQPIPRVPTDVTWADRAAQAGLLLQVNSRDLPRHPGGPEGRRFYEVENPNATWLDFRKWAWNQDWFELSKEEARSLLPSEGRATKVADPVVRRLVRDHLVDNVRGQVQNWEDRHIQAASLSAERVSLQGKIERIRYRGQAKAGDGAKAWEGTLLGLATFDHAKGRFTRFELLATGMRSGRCTFNNRQGDEAPAPMAVSFIIEGQYDKKG